MATVSDTARNVIQLPELPPAEPMAQTALRARSVPRPADDATEGERRRVSRWAVPAVSAALSGGSLLHAQPPSLAQTWARHRASATHYNAWAMSVPRHAWGVIHTALAAVLLAVIWVIESPPRLAFAAGIGVACWFYLPHL